MELLGKKCKSKISDSKDSTMTNMFITHVSEVLKEKPPHGRPRRRLHAVSQLVEDSGPVRAEPLFAGEPASVVPENTTSRCLAEPVESAAVTLQDLNMREPIQPQESHSVLTGAKMFVPPPGAPPLPHSPGEEDGSHTEEEEGEDEGHRAPLELLAEFLGAVMKKDFRLANKLCQMILIYEPEHQEAQQFLPLIQEKLLQVQEEEQSDEDEDDEDDESDSSEEGDSESTGSDDETAHSSGSTSSSTLSFSSSSDEEEDKQERRHKPCPPSRHPT